MKYFAYIRRNDGSRDESRRYDSKDELYAKITAYIIANLEARGEFYEHISIYEDKRGERLGF